MLKSGASGDDVAPAAGGRKSDDERGATVHARPVGRRVATGRPELGARNSRQKTSEKRVEGDEKSKWNEKNHAQSGRRREYGGKTTPSSTRSAFRFGATTRRLVGDALFRSIDGPRAVPFGKKKQRVAPSAHVTREQARPAGDAWRDQKSEGFA